MKGSLHSIMAFDIDGVLIKIGYQGMRGYSSLKSNRIYGHHKICTQFSFCIKLTLIITLAKRRIETLSHSICKFLPV